VEVEPEQTAGMAWVSDKGKTVADRDLNDDEDIIPWEELLLNLSSNASF